MNGTMNNSASEEEKKELEARDIIMRNCTSASVYRAWKGLVAKGFVEHAEKLYQGAIRAPGRFGFSGQD